MSISARAAATELAEIGLGREQVRHLLAAGVAGSPRRAAGALLYDEGAVRALRERPWVDPRELEAACPHGVYVARIGRRRRIDARAPWRECADELARQPPLTPMTVALLAARIRGFGPLPWVATMSGLVVLTADAVGVTVDRDGHTAWVLEAPGPWRGAAEGRWLPTGRGPHGILRLPAVAARQERAAEVGARLQE